MHSNLVLPHVQALALILSKCRYQKDKANAFAKNGARNILFRLEALCRIGRIISDKKYFTKWLKEFKSLEDILGEMDHLTTMISEFSKVPSLATVTKTQLQKQLTLVSASLSEKLQKDGWLSGLKLKEFETTLGNYDFNTKILDRRIVAMFLIEEIQVLEKDYADGKIDFTFLESGVHEFRRKIRWFGIYAQVLDGIIQLRNVPVVDENLRAYCSKEIVQSPFNVMSKPNSDVVPLYIQSTHWYALSWIIQHLGDLKDIGLRYEVFSELTSKSKFKNKTGRALLTKKFINTCAYHPYELNIRAESAVDKFLYRDRIMKNICRDLKRSAREGTV